MKIVSLKNPYINGFLEEDSLTADYLEKVGEAYEALVSGRLYARFIDGDRKGSVAKLAPNPKYGERKAPEIAWGHRVWVGGNMQYGGRFYNDRFYTIATWTDRKNKPQVDVPDDDIELVIADDLPTVWAKFDAKAAKAQILAGLVVTDIDGTRLSVGDRVMYINARYGSAMTLTRGTIAEFAISADSRGHSVTTVIESDDGEISQLSKPGTMVYRLT